MYKKVKIYICTNRILYVAERTSSAVSEIMPNVAKPPWSRCTLGIVPLLTLERPGRTRFEKVWLKLKKDDPLVPSSAARLSTVISTSGTGLDILTFMLGYIT